MKLTYGLPITSMQLKAKMNELQAKDNLSINDILRMNMLEYKEELRKRAIKELKEELNNSNNDV